MKKYISTITALFISLFIYLFYRSEKTVATELFISALSVDFYNLIKFNIVNFIPLNRVAIYSLPGGLWVFCVTLLAKDFYLILGKHRLKIVFVPLVFSIGLELFQLLGIANGRFDIGDIVFYLIFWLLVYSLPSDLGEQNIVSPLTMEGFLCIACFISVYLAHVNY